jgi:hypothetical protein
MGLYLHSVYNSGKITAGTLPLKNEVFINKGNTINIKKKQKKTSIGIYYINKDDIEEFKNTYSVNSLIPMILTSLKVENYPDIQKETGETHLENSFWAIPDKSLELWNSFSLQDVLQRPEQNFEQFQTFIYVSILSFKKHLNLDKIVVVRDEENNWYTLCDDLFFFRCKKNPDTEKQFSYMIPDGNLKRAVLVNTSFGENPFTTILKL